MYYAQITNGIVTTVSELSGEVNAPNLIPIDGLDTSKLGKAYAAGEFTDAVPPVVVDPCLHLLDIGPFYDRFSTAKMPVLTSPDATVKAIIADCNVRKWIDLQNPDVANGLAYIGTVVAALTPAIQTAILTTPVTVEENRALRKLYF